MPHFTLRFANRSVSDQDWIIYQTDHFTLHPDYVRTAGLDINVDRTYQISVNTEMRFAAVNLTYTAATNLWSITSQTPNEFQLQTGND